MNNHIVPTIEQMDDTLVVSSMTVADGTGNQHASILRLVRENITDFEEFGQVGFEIRPGYNNAQVSIALLNEQQATLLMTYLRNNKIVKNFKIALVKAFYEMAHELHNAPALTNDEIVAQALQITTARVKALEPKAEAWDTLAGAQGDYSVAEAAQMISRTAGLVIGRNRLFQIMHDLGWLYRWGKRQSWRAYQDQIDTGRLVLRMSAAFQNQKTGEMELPAPTIRVTAKGVAFLRAHLSKEEDVA